MSRKLSKSDDPGAVMVTPNMPVSQHFAVGTFIVEGNRRGEILSVDTCETCPEHETTLRISWDDGTVSVVTPIALNR